MALAFKSKVVAGFGSAFLVLAFVGLLSYTSFVRNADDRRWVIHSHIVIETLDEVQNDITGAETSQRGYIITEQDFYQKPYQEALDRLHQDVTDLRTLISDNPVQQRELDGLESLIAERLAEMQARIQIRRQSGFDAAAAAIADRSTQLHMDRIREAIGRMRAEEQRLLAARYAELDTSTRRAKAVILTGDALALLFVIFATFVVQQEMARRLRADEKVRLLNTGLEERIAERTAELAERNKDLARSNAELQQFAYVASHDLQEPLRMVASFTQLLAKRYQEKLDDDARDFINYAVDGATRMQALITDLLTYSRVGTQGKPLEPTSCDAVLDRTLTTLKLLIQETGAVITREPLPTVMADPLQLGQLFQNLITNAIKFRGENPPNLHISAEHQGGEWQLAVQDNGIGIAPEHADRIFVIFQRLHTKTEYPGTGIGLAICKKIAERHGGRIWVEPSPGGGSTFRFTILPAPTHKTYQSVERREHDEHRVPAATR